MSVLIKVCAWCKTDPADVPEGAQVSHGICPTHAREFGITTCERVPTGLTTSGAFLRFIGPGRVVNGYAYAEEASDLADAAREAGATRYDLDGRGPTLEVDGTVRPLAEAHVKLVWEQLETPIRNGVFLIGRVAAVEVDGLDIVTTRASLVDDDGAGGGRWVEQHDHHRVHCDPAGVEKGDMVAVNGWREPGSDRVGVHEIRMVTRFRAADPA